MCHCGAMVKEFLARADKPGSTPADALSCFFVLLFLSVWLSPEFYFGKGISKALDLHTGQAYDQIKTISSQDMSLLRNSRIFFSMLVDNHDKQHTVHRKLY